MATYYVDGSATDDTGTGAVGDPWKTLTFSFQQLVAGDTLLLAGSTDFTDWPNINTAARGNYADGTAILPITVQQKAAATAEIVGGEDRFEKNWWTFRDLIFHQRTYLFFGIDGEWEVVGIRFIIAHSRIPPLL